VFGIHFLFETLSGKKVSLPSDLGSESALLVIGFTNGSQAQTKAWSLRVRGLILVVV
jgi:hypothetical protein